MKAQSRRRAHPAAASPMRFMTTCSNPFVLLVCLLLGCSVVACSKPKPMNHFANLRQEYLDGLLLAKPHLATFMGDHRFDDRWPDYSARGIELRARVLRQQKLRLASVDKGRLPLEEQIDAEIFSDGIELELLYLSEIREWERNPRLQDTFPYYDPREIVATRVSDILHGDFAPAESRLRSLASLLKGLPEFLQQVQSQLKNPARLVTEQAIADNRGRLELFQGQVVEFVRTVEVSASLRDDAEAARKSAVAALEGYQRFLEQDLLPRSSGDWRLGADLFRKKFPVALQTTVTPEALAAKAKQTFQHARQELFTVAVTLHGELFPRKTPPGTDSSPEAQSRLIRLVKDELSKDHPSAAELVEAHRKNLDDFRRFIVEHDLIALPPAETLIVQEMPPFKRGSSAAEYLAPGVLERRDKWTATYFVDPIDPTWAAARVESILRGNNDYEVQLTAMHEAYPGHHTQFYLARQNLNPLRAVLWNAPFVEGWAVYGENLMTRLGYGGARNARYRFFALRGDMIVATNALIDAQLHSGQMSEGEAVRFMVEEGFQEQAQAEKKLRRAKLDSTQLSQYFLGLDEILQLEKEVKARAGTNFRQREFNEKLTGHGSIAVKHLRRYFF
jgi:uncharacterized protein (DUF885 family)